MAATDRLRSLLDGFDSALPLERARTIPSPWYFDPELAEAERRWVFGDSWQAIGRADQVASVGSFLTADVAGEPIVVVRGEDDRLRAFVNVCRHRAARVVEPDQGCASRLRCRYHGWTYDLAGKLRGTPEFDGVEEFRREENGLVPLAVAEFGPTVWVHLGGDPTRSDLIETLGRLPARTADGLAPLRFAERRTYDIACNWKVYVDNYLDGGYHVNTVHPDLAGVLDYAQYRTINEGLTSLQTSPMAPGDGLAASVRRGRDAQYWWVFPNFMLNLYDGLMDVNLVLPLAPDRCRVVFDFYFESLEDADFVARSAEVTEQVQVEDMEISAEVQRGLSSRYYDVGRYAARREAGVHHFHRLLAEALRRAPG